MSIVESSIHQMQEYGKFLESVVKSVEEFANEHVEDGAAQDYLVSKFPGAVDKKVVDGIAQVVLNDDMEEGTMPDFQSLLNLASKPDLDDENVGKQLVQGAKIQMAKQKQQLLATMALLGINRIVVTEGEIKASVMFDVSSTDTAHKDSGMTRDHTDTHYDYESEWAQKRNIWGTERSGSSSGSVNTKVNTSHAQANTSSDSRLETHAKLTGSVLVRFKSETFPLEKMSSPMELASVTEKSQK
jgi:hypothetical protein